MAHKTRIVIGQNNKPKKGERYLIQLKLRFIVKEKTYILLDNGIVNRYIEPNNIIIKKDGSIKIIDYSTAYQMPKLSLSSALTGIMLINWTKTLLKSNLGKAFA